MCINELAVNPKPEGLRGERNKKNFQRRLFCPSGFAIADVEREAALSGFALISCGSEKQPSRFRTCSIFAIECYKQFVAHRANKLKEVVETLFANPVTNQ